MKPKNIALYGFIILFFWNSALVIAQVDEGSINSSIALKVPGNDAVIYSLKEVQEEGVTRLKADQKIPVTIERTIHMTGNLQVYDLTVADQVMEVVITRTRISALTTSSGSTPAIRTTTVSFTCLDFGTGVTCDLLKKPLRFTRQIAGLCVKIG